ncbi:hypothetical protein BSKO_00794 [Bryopsis sp. KO-2023]|nr:hypothetical protein BSKO_00794 [Bryopsis sp. KO-2023]
MVAAGWINPLAYFGDSKSQQDESPTLLKVNSAPIPRAPSKDKRRLDRVPGDPTFGGWPAPDCPTVIHMVMKNGKEMADNPGFLWLDDSLREKQKYTYGEVAEGARAVAHTLTTVNGLKKGDRALLVFIPDGSRDFIIAFFGCLLAGVIAVPVYPPNPASLVQDLERMTKIVEMAGVKVALTTSKFKNLMVVARMKLAFTTGFQYSWPAKLPWQAVDGIGACPPAARTMDEWLAQVRPEDLAFLQFTSGSTGFPKGVMVSHNCLSHNISCQRSTLRRTLKGTVRMCGWLPLYHDFGLIGGVICGSALGATMIGFSPITFLKDPLSWLIVLSKYKVHNTGAPNFALARCIREWNKLPPEKRPQLDLSNLLSLNIGAEPIQERVLRQFASTFACVGLHPKALNPSYGLAEHVVFLCTSLGVSEKQKVDENGVVVGGKVEFGIDVRIVDHKTLRECPNGVAGEIWVCSPSVADGYWNLPDLSREVFRAKLDGKEFLRTGDLGYMQEDRLYVTGRLKDVIIVGGANYYPQDIEQTVFDTSDMIRPGRVAAFSLGDGNSELNDRVGLVVEIRDENMRPDMCQDMFQKITNAVRLNHGLSVSRIKLIKPR